MNGLHGLGAIGLVGGLVGLVIAIAFLALILMLSTRIVAGFMPNYWRISLVVVVAGVISFIVGMVLKLVGVMTPTPGFHIGQSLVSAVIGALIGAAVLNGLVKRPDGASLGFGKALLAEIIYNAILLGISLLLASVFAGMLAGMMAHGAH